MAKYYLEPPTMGKFAAKAAQGKFSNKVITTYKAYLDNPEIAKQENPVLNRPPSQPIYIEPFSFDLAVDQYVKASASQTAVTTYLARVNTGGVRAAITQASGETSFRIDRFRPAKVQIKTGRSTTGTREISKTSGLPYKYYGGRNISIPFGRAIATEDQQQAFSVIKAAILSGASATNAPLVTLLPEKYTG